MDLSGPVVVQCHSYLPMCPIWACPWAKNLSNQAALGPDFAEPLSLKPVDGFELGPSTIARNTALRWGRRAKQPEVGTDLPWRLAAHC